LRAASEVFFRPRLQMKVRHALPLIRFRFDSVS